MMEINVSFIANKVLHIAIADDHPVVLGALKNELGRLPEVRIDLEADTGEALLTALKRTPCEIVVTDFAMPNNDNDDSDGFALIKRIKAEHPSSKVIVYTAMGNIAVVKRLYRMGVFSVINKKEKADELINACLATQSSKQAYFPVSLRGETGNELGARQCVCAKQGIDGQRTGSGASVRRRQFARRYL